jgi:hypothetical protein
MGGYGYGTGLGYGGLMYSPYGYPLSGYGTYSYLPYPGIAQPSYSRVLSYYQIRTGIGVLGNRPIGVGLTSSPRPVYGLRPTGATRLGAGPRVGGGRR